LKAVDKPLNRINLNLALTGDGKLMTENMLTGFDARAIHGKDLRIR